MKKSYYFVLVAMLALVFVGCAKKEVKQAENKTEVTATDYSKSENWERITTDIKKPVDTFFIFPTLLMTSENEKVATVDEMRKTPLLNMARTQMFPVFEENTNLFAPYYRQVPFSFAETFNKEGEEYRKFLYENEPYADIKASLDYYFEHYNNGRPFILAGHSQGSSMCYNVLEHYLKEHPEYLKRMVNAYTLGWAVPKEYFEKNTHLKFATGEFDTGSVISWNAIGPDATEKTIVVPKNAAVINPINWKLDDTYASKEENLGSLADDGKIIMNYADAKINLEKGYVECNTELEYLDSPKVLGDKSLHNGDYSLFFNNIRKNIFDRISRYLVANDKNQTMINADSKTLDYIKNANRSLVNAMWDNMEAGQKMIDGQKGKGKDDPTLPETTNEFKKVDFEDIKVLTSQKSKDYDKILLYLHGGAYVYGIDKVHFDYIDRLVTETNIKAYAPLYKLAPDYTYKDSFETIYKLYKELQKENKEIIIAGDSAGGGFSLAFCHYLKDKGEKLPDKMILISPWVDVTTSNPKIELYKNTEIMLPRTALYASGKAWAGDKDWTDKLISPINGDFSKMPKTLLFGSTDEFFYPDITKTYGKFIDAGADIKFVTIEHGFHIIPTFKDMKEASDALKLAKDFINK